jgi:hypothetical protein
MFFIPGFVISILTFPGVIVHEFAHRFFADVAKVPVYKVSYFRLGNPAGYVMHGHVNSLKKSFLISVAPFLVNSVLCMLITFTSIIPIYILDAINVSWVFYVLLWIGFSIGMHAFPSDTDTKNFLAVVKGEKHHKILVMFAHLFSWFFGLANLLRVFWADAFYALGLCLFLPLIFGLF